MDASISVCVQILLLSACPKIISINFISNYTQNTALQIHLPSGVIQGKLKLSTATGMPYISYEGIPYAKPPIGDLRFQPPQPSTGWKGILAADGDVPSCLQIPMSDLYESEDCLYINVYVPKLAPENGQSKPVMVWIYGGGFLFGVANSSYYRPDFLLEQDVIVVHFNYRLNVFGFISTDDAELPGNYGLKDQHAALTWIHNNIQHFGGDPDRVTIFGESAGGASVQYHLLSPNSRGLFSAAISESGSALCSWALQTNPRQITNQIGASSGYVGRDTKNLVNHLKSLSAQKLRRAALGTILLNSIKMAPSLIFAPVVEPEHDTAFITRNTYESLKAGDFQPIPHIVGFNSEEAGGAQAVLELGEPFLNFLPNDVLIPSGLNNGAKRISDEIRRFYFRNHKASRSQQYMNFFSDIAFYRPILESARLYSIHAPVYMYTFSYDGYLLGKKAFSLGEERKVNGVMHAEEIWYLFGRHDLKQATGTDKLVRERMIKLWTNFAKYMNPTPHEEALFEHLTWPQFQNDSYTYLDINDEISVQTNFRKDVIEFWEHIFNTYGRPPYTTF